MLVVAVQVRHTIAPKIGVLQPWSAGANILPCGQTTGKQECLQRRVAQFSTILGFLEAIWTTWTLSVSYAATLNLSLLLKIELRSNLLMTQELEGEQTHRRQQPSYQMTQHHQSYEIADTEVSFESVQCKTLHIGTGNKTAQYTKWREETKLLRPLYRSELTAMLSP